MVREKVTKFTRKFNETLRTAVIAAFGFLIALVWRDFITEYIDRITSLSPVQGRFITALIITVIGVIAIILITPKEPEEK